MGRIVPPRTKGFKPPQYPSPERVAPPPSPAPPPKPKLRIIWFKPGHEKQLALAICAVLIVLFGVLSFSAALTKSPTYDEPVHAMAAWSHLHLGDFRINYEDPPLWQYWAGLLNGASAIQVDLADRNPPTWANVADNVYIGVLFAKKALFQTAGNDGQTFVERTRFMLMLLGVALAVVLTFWSWKLGGPLAAVIACTLFCLDPNFMAHSNLVKNDAPMSLMMTAVFLACWQVGRRMTLINASLLSLLVAGSLNTKFTGVLLVPMLVVLLGIRVLLPEPWIVLGKSRSRFLRKLTAAVLLLVVIGITSFLGIWACYLFRFDPSPDPAISLNTTLSRNEAMQYGYRAKHHLPWPRDFDPSVSLQDALEPYSKELEEFGAGIKSLGDELSQLPLPPELQKSVRDQLASSTQRYNDYAAVRDKAQSLLKGSPTADAQRDMAMALNTSRNDMDLQRFSLGYFKHVILTLIGPPSTFDAVFDFMMNHRILPSAWLHGVLFVRARSVLRGSFLLDQRSETGFWYYFPIAILLKAPVATILAMIGALAAGIWVLSNRWREWRRFAWALACLLVPLAIYLTSIMTSNLNIGIRHALPLFPPAYIACGVLVALAWRRWGRRVLIAASGLGIMLIAETTLAWPNYIAYFNFAVGGPRGGIHLLADSNLDWGQDLPLLAKWKREHPDVPLALAYFPQLAVDPAFYGIKYDPLPGGPPPPEIAKTHILAVGATHVQGVYREPTMDFTSYQKLKPFEVLGGTIYLYDLRGEK